LIASKDDLIRLLKAFSNAFGPPGHEEEIRKLVIEEVRPYSDEVYVDSLGNVIITKRGNSKFPKIMLDAHMDEVGIIVTHIDSKGFIRFHTLGGIDPRSLYAQKVIIKGKKAKIQGFIGAKPPHLMSQEESKKVIGLTDLFIDVGASSKDEVLDMGIEIGSVGTFDTQFKILTQNRVSGKAFDDRVGLVVLVSLFKILKDSDHNLVGNAAVQEEVGLRGARVAAWRIEPDLALALEGTAAGDVPGTPEHLSSTSLGRGPAITIADRSVITHPKILRTLIDAAKESSIPYQFKKMIVGGTDAGAIHLTKSGVPSGVVSVPCRYIHGPVSILDLRDLENTIKLVKYFIEKISLI